MRDKILIVLTIIVLGISGWLYYENAKKENIEKERLRVVEEKVVPLQKEKESLKLEIEAFESEYDKILDGKGTLSFVFVGMDQRIRTWIFPKLQTKGIKATLVITDELFPGEKGCLTKAQFEEMIEAGWDYAIGCTREQLDTDYLLKVQNKLVENGYKKSEILYFERNHYDETDAYSIDNVTYKYIIHHAEGDLEFTSEYTDTKNDIWHIGAYRWNDVGAKNYIISLGSSGKSMAFSIGFTTDEGEFYDTQQFESLLRYLDAYRNDNILETISIREAYEYKTEINDARVINQMDYDSKKAEYDKEMKRINDELNAIYDQYHIESEIGD